MQRWQLQDAKARLSELVRTSQAEGPQEISVHGRATAVVVSKRDFDRHRRRKPSLVRFLRQSPLRGVDLQIERDRSTARKVGL